MLIGLDPWLIMFVLYVVTSIINIWQLKLEDSNSNPSLQKILVILMFITGFLSLPITLVSFGIIYFTVARIDRNHQSEINKIRIESDREIRSVRESCDARISKYDSLIHDDRKRAYNDGYKAGMKETRSFYEYRLERARSDGYRDGYADGQKDYPQGINLLEELEK